MLTGYLSTLPTDTLLGTGVMFYGNGSTPVRLGVTDGAPDFDPGVELSDIAFDQKPSRLKGTIRRTQFAPVIKGVIKEFGPSASGGQIGVLEQASSEATASGVTTTTPLSAGALISAGSYLTDVRWIFERGSGGFAAIWFPIARVRKWTKKGVDRKEAQISFEIEAVGDPANDLGTAPYAIEIRTSLPAGAGDEIAFLRGNIVGGDSAILALYSTLFHVTVSGGSVTQWDDARGAGFGPSLIGQAGTQPPWDAVNLLIAGDGNGEMSTAASALFDLSTAKALAIVSSAPTASKNLAGIAESSAGNRVLVVLTNGSTITGQVNAASNTAVVDSTIALSATRRLVVVSKNATTGIDIDVPNHARVSGANGGSVAAGNNQLTLFDYFPGGGARMPGSARALLVLNREATIADIAALVNWAQTYHGAVMA